MGQNTGPHPKQEYCESVPHGGETVKIDKDMGSGHTQFLSKIFLSLEHSAMTEHQDQSKEIYRIVHLYDVIAKKTLKDRAPFRLN